MTRLLKNLSELPAPRMVIPVRTGQPDVQRLQDLESRKKSLKANLVKLADDFGQCPPSKDMVRTYTWRQKSARSKEQSLEAEIDFLDQCVLEYNAIALRTASSTPREHSLFKMRHRGIVVQLGKPKARGIIAGGKTRWGA